MSLHAASPGNGHAAGAAAWAPNGAPPLKRALPPAAFDPALVPADPLAASWLAEATLRLRRELAWCWHLSGTQSAQRSLPLARTPIDDSIDRLRHHDARQAFFATDVAATYLGEEIARVSIRRAQIAQARSGWQAVATAAGLDEHAQFVLALALAARADAAFAPVAGAVQQDGRATLALAQRLWHAPLALIACLDPAHPLYAFGLLQAPTDWHQPLELPAPVAAALLDPHTAWPAALRPLPSTDTTAAAATAATAGQAAALAWLRALPPAAMQIVPLLLPAGASAAPIARNVAAATGRPIVQLSPEIGPDHAALRGLACAAWLHGADLLLPPHWHSHPGALPLDQALRPLAALPLRLLLPVHDSAAVRALPPAWLGPTLVVEPLATSERALQLASALPPTMGDAAAEAARRFRLNDLALAQVTTTLRALPQADESTLHALCRTAATLDLGQLAQPVTPRFALASLVLPPRQRAQVRAIVEGMRALGRVHQDWGTAKTWNEGGIAVLFCGPPGTGKTMCAEALADELALPMYRIDLSQVVNKYIGETEKNLRRIFDAAEAAECLLLFDEADSLFGKRTEVKDAHDRFANIEVSYLLERMERFKGLAVLATNRRKDVDEAFTRRLRFIVDFPLPGAPERECLWRGMFPGAVDVSGIDFGFIAQHFEMAGGAMRSASFNACLHAAAATRGEPAVDMPALLVAIKREIEKAGREIQRDQFGRYAHLLPEAS
ncbi:ATP-binding protein [Roseateles sp.]|uniref:AAA family ATPase n=1 Tax=Roseateles sp. TaxID=1971397 RepID=UPI003266F21F